MTRTSLDSRRSGAHRQERGFALLVIFLIAAAVAFTMYQELPRAAFESARDKEQVLMDRGNQYKRAIQVFYAVNKRYPAEIKDLENTNEKRFLRRRYLDPMTGQDEWRLIHTNGSFLTDSLVQKPPTQNASNGSPGAGQTPGGGPLGANNMNSAPVPATTAASNPNDPAFAVNAAAQNPAALRRPSDRGFATGPGFPQSPVLNQAINPFGPNPANFDPNDPSTWPPITLASSSGQPGQPPQPGFGQRPPNAQIMAGQPPGGVGQPSPGQQPGYPQPAPGILGQLPGQGGANPQPSSVNFPNPQNENLNPAQFGFAGDGQLTPQAGQPVPSPSPSQQVPAPNRPANLAAAGFNPQNPVAPSAQLNPGLAGSTSGNAALNAIDSALFRPNQAPAPTGPTGSPGIAGVASKFEGPSIKTYRERSKYQEWEFVFEPAVNPIRPLGAPGPNPLQNQNGLTPSSGAPGSGQTPAGGATSPFPPTAIFSQPNPFAPPSPAR